MASTRTSQKPRKVGPNIVRAWLDTVINPLLRGLDSESVLLRKDNWTWRFEQESLLSLVPIRSFISFEALDNLEQFLDLGPAERRTVRRLIDQHDGQVRLVREACERLHRVIKESDELRVLYDRIKSESKIPLRPGQTFDSLFGAYGREQHFDVLAEEIVNGTGMVPSYFSTAPLWNRYRDELVRVRNASGIRRRWQELKHAGQALMDSVQALIALLKGVRQELSLKYDLPLVEVRSL